MVPAGVICAPPGICSGIRASLKSSDLACVYFFFFCTQKSFKFYWHGEIQVSYAIFRHVLVLLHVLCTMCSMLSIH